MFAFFKKSTVTQLTSGKNRTRIQIFWHPEEIVSPHLCLVCDMWVSQKQVQTWQSTALRDQPQVCHNHVPQEGYTTSLRLGFSIYKMEAVIRVKLVPATQCLLPWPWLSSRPETIKITMGWIVRGSFLKNKIWGCIHGWFLIMYDRNPQNSIKQLSFN